jgi:hypothetical protein
MRNNRTDDRHLGVRSQPLMCGKVLNLRGADRYRATLARSGDNQTITHDWRDRQKIQATILGLSRAFWFGEPGPVKSWALHAKGVTKNQPSTEAPTSWFVVVVSVDSIKSGAQP